MSVFAGFPSPGFWLSPHDCGSTWRSHRAMLAPPGPRVGERFRAAIYFHLGGLDLYPAGIRTAEAAFHPNA